MMLISLRFIKSNLAEMFLVCESVQEFGRSVTQYEFERLLYLPGGGLEAHESSSPLD